MRRRTVIVAVLAVAGVPALGATTACDDDEPPPVNRLVIATAGPEEVYHRLGSAFGEAARKRWKIPVEVLPTTGSVDNVRRLASGEADIAFTTVDVAASAQDGEDPFAGAVPLATLASLYDDYLHIVVRADSGIDSISGLARRRVSTGPEDSAADIVARRVLDAVVGGPLGSSAPVYSHHESTAVATAALSQGTVDALVTTGGLPDAAIENLARSVEVRLLPVENEIATLSRRYGQYLVTRSIPAGTYGIDGDLVTLGIRTVLVVRRTMPDEVAYRLVRLLFEARAALQRAHPEAERLDPRSAIATFPLDLHPGVSRYYREVKLLA